MWTSITRRAAQGGFSLVELLLGLALTLCLSLGLAPVWVSLQGVAAGQADDTIWVGQARVAVARLERDVRLASCLSCPFPMDGMVLLLTKSHVVLLQQTQAGTAQLVEWELVNSALMRRTGPCPPARPATFPHSLYTDNKTIVENVDISRSAFSCSIEGGLPGLPQTADLPLVEGVRLVLSEKGRDGAEGPQVAASAAVGR